jgi:hypothetical protein
MDLSRLSSHFLGKYFWSRVLSLKYILLRKTPVRRPSAIEDFVSIEPETQCCVHDCQHLLGLVCQSTASLWRLTWFSHRNRLQSSRRWRTTPSYYFHSFSSPSSSHFQSASCVNALDHVAGVGRWLARTASICVRPYDPLSQVDTRQCRRWFLVSKIVFCSSPG